MVDDISKPGRNYGDTNQTFIGYQRAPSSTLTDLKATQTQLIHAEKMASLGEMTGWALRMKYKTR
jgi:hypothetical protein